jgi:ABC-type dipeptide/oligopeptide/nickel transport system permease subunit
MALALLLSLAGMLVALGVHWLERESGAVGSVVKGLGRIAVFLFGSPPAFVLGLILIMVFSIGFKILPLSGMRDLSSQDGFGDLYRHMLLPALTLAAFPAMLTGQAAARALTLPGRRSGWSGWVSGLLILLASWFGQVGGMLGTLVVVETIFAWPGIGRLLYESALRLDLPVAFGVLAIMLPISLAGRLLAELFAWGTRLIPGQSPSMVSQPTPWRNKARKIWVVCASLLLLYPLVLALAGLTTSRDAALRADPAVRLARSSSEHPWGTDQLGRDLRSRALRGAGYSLGIAGLAALTVLVPAALGGGLTGFLTSKRTWWSESLADLLLIPADMIVLFPAIPLMLLSSILIRSPNGGVMPGLLFILTLVILPRLVHAGRTLWNSAPDGNRWLKMAGLGLAVLFLAGLYAAFGWFTTVGVMGMGVPPPTPEMGVIIGESRLFLIQGQGSFTYPALIVWGCAFAFYTAADALVGYFNSKQPLGWLGS